jgi:hypothetical protein
MSEEMDVILRRSLDELDRLRTRQLVGLLVVIALFLSLAFGIVLTLRQNHPEPEFWRMLIANAELMTFNVAFGVLGICLFMTRMTKKILKAIELSSKQ